jgi:hypothetical protein
MVNPSLIGVYLFLVATSAYRSITRKQYGYLVLALAFTTVGAILLWRIR